MLRQPVDRLHRRQMLFLIGEQLKREELGKDYEVRPVIRGDVDEIFDVVELHVLADRSEEHTSELQSLMRISYAVFCLKKKKKITYITPHTTKTTHTHITIINYTLN